MKANPQNRPVPDSYWVVEQRLLAGEYPGALNQVEGRQKVQRFLQAGITFFLDLTEEHELAPYAGWLRQAAAGLDRAVEHRRLPIRDMGIPTRAEMGQILETIDQALARGETVYVHCFGGIGRTGTVVGCYMVRHGMTGQQALAEIARLRQGTPDGERVSPETGAQRQMVLTWSEKRA